MLGDDEDDDPLFSDQDDEIVDVQPRVFEVEVALDAVQDLVVDLAPAAQLDHAAALGVEKLAAQPLVGLRPLLDLAVVLVVEARREAVWRKSVGAAHALGGVVAHPVLAG